MRYIIAQHAPSAHSVGDPLVTHLLIDADRPACGAAIIPERLMIRVVLRDDARRLVTCARCRRTQAYKAL